MRTQHYPGAPGGRDPAAPVISFDPKQMHQVLINLFKNALEAMPQGGEITIASRVKGAHAGISLSDTGEGMPPEVAANIFQPYFTTKEKGTGLGLAICQNIIQEHGGCILVDSAPGQGTTFTMKILLEEAVPVVTTLLKIEGLKVQFHTSRGHSGPWPG